MALRTAQVAAPGWRPAAIHDDDAIVAMCLALYTEDPGPAPIQAAQVRRTLAQLRGQPARGQALVLELEDRVVGYALLISFWSNEAGGELCTIDELYVAPAQRSRGHGSALLRALASRGGPWGGAAIGLSLEVTNGNTRALRLYERLGFKAGNRLMRQLIGITLALLVPAVAVAAPAASVPQAVHASVASEARLAGNHALSEDALRAAITDASASSEDEAAGAVQQAYLAHGYLDTKVSGTIDPLTHKPLVTVTEGARYSLRKIDFVETGTHPRDELGDPDRATALYPGKLGAVFERAPVQAWIAAIKDRYDTAGYGAILATPITDIDTTAHTVGLTLEVSRNRVYKIKAVTIVGATGTEQRKLKGELGLHAGEVYSARAVKHAEDQLRTSRQWRRVSISADTPDHGVSAALTIIIRLTR